MMILVFELQVDTWTLLERVVSPLAMTHYYCARNPVSEGLVACLPELFVPEVSFQACTFMFFFRFM